MPVVVFMLLVICSIPLKAQSNPIPFDLSIGSYSFTNWEKTNPAGTYPNNMIFHTTKIRDPKINDEMDSDWVLPYNLTSRSRVLGLADRGFAFQNTSLQQDTGAFLGAAVLSLNTTNRSNIHVNWTGRTISPAERTYNIILQYRIGETGQFVSLPSEYSMSSEPNDEMRLPIIILPSVCDNQPIVQLRWKYYFSGIGEQGTRPQIGVDDIFISSIAMTSVEKEDLDMDMFIMQQGRIIRLTPMFECNNSTIRIINLLGKVLIETNLANKTIDLSDYQSGVYLLELIYNNKSKVKKVIIE